MRNIVKLSILTLAGVAVMGLTGAAPSFAQDKITIASWGGAYSASQRKAFHEPYMVKTGITVLEDEWQGTMGQIRGQVDTGNYLWHVIDSERDMVIAGCDENLLEPIPWDLMGGEDAFIEGYTEECGVPNITWSSIYAYDVDKFPASGAQPTTIQDLFDVEKFPGMRGFLNNAKPNLEWALLADGVPMDQVYGLLETDAGVQRALDKFDSIRDHIIWWSAGAQPPQMLADGEVVMTTAWNGRIFNAIKNENKNFHIVWDAHGLELDYWIVPKGHPEKDAAFAYIAYTVRPEIQKDQSKYISYGPTVKKAVPMINPDILKDLPAAYTDNVLYVDIAFWADRREELAERWNAWQAK